MLACRLRIDERKIKRQARYLVPHFCAKRAGFVLVKRQLLALLIHRILRCLRTNLTFETVYGFFKQHEKTEHNAQGFEEQTDKLFHDDVRMAIAFRG